MTPLICPSILSFDPANLLGPVAQLQAAGADVVHLDIMDGQFVPPITFGAQLAKSLASVTNLPREAHLMTLTPEAHFDAFAEAGCARITFHIEATAHAHRLCQSLRGRGLQAGVAINPGTPVQDVEPLLQVADLILVMTVNPGWGGQKFIPECVEKVRSLRNLHPTIAIQVDGGVDPLTITELWQAGATHFVTGSYLTRAASYGQAVQELKNACP